MTSASNDLTLVREIFGPENVYDMGQVRDIPPPAKRLPVDRARERAKVKNAIRSCKRCPLGPAADHAVIQLGPSTARMAAIGAAPSEADRRLGRLAQDRPGKLLRALMAQAEIDPDDDVTWVNIVQCVTDKKPSQECANACEDHMYGQLDVAEVQYVLLVGAHALNQFHPQAKVSRVHGRMWGMGNWICMAITSPDSANYGDKRAIKAEIYNDLYNLRCVISENSDARWDDFISHLCFFCDENAVHIDNDGIGFCEGHYKKQVDPEYVSAQEEMF